VLEGCIELLAFKEPPSARCLHAISDMRSSEQLPGLHRKSKDAVESDELAVDLAVGNQLAHLWLSVDTPVGVFTSLPRHTYVRMSRVVIAVNRSVSERSPMSRA
jgi:hypothetical protein